MTDASGQYYGFDLGGTMYYYVYNAQGDVIGIVDGDGDYVARYSYDAWGAPVRVTDGDGVDVSGNAGHIANMNPIRYRGYYWDGETGLYYLQTRYYDPAVGRFVNADGLVSTGQGVLSYNMFVYCLNNPTNYGDMTGCQATAISWARKLPTLTFGLLRDRIYQGYVTGGMDSDGNEAYRIIASLTFKNGSIPLDYAITQSGIIQFDFSKNNFAAITKYGLVRGLAQGILSSAKDINSNFLQGRTILGLGTELMVHYDLYVLGIKTVRTHQADMGALWKSSLGYDSNAWVFEAAAPIRWALSAGVSSGNTGMFEILFN